MRVYSALHTRTVSKFKVFQLGFPGHQGKCYTVSFGRGPGFESGIAHNDTDALQDHTCVENLRVEKDPYI